MTLEELCLHLDGLKAQYGGDLPVSVYTDHGQTESVQIQVDVLSTEDDEDVAQAFSEIGLSSLRFVSIYAE